MCYSEYMPFTIFCFYKCDSKKEKKILVPKQENKFVEVYKPAGDYFFGPNTKELKEGQWYDRWIPNDHTFVKAEDGKWHIFGITHPYVDPKLGGIHQGEFASFHAISSVDKFKNSLEKNHYKDLPKILTPKERPGEITANQVKSLIALDYDRKPYNTNCLF